MTMKAGTYYIGDLCYVMHKEWDEVCNNLEDGEHTLADGRTYAIYGTAHGDGRYDSAKGAIDVDSGTIGCILVEDIREGLPSDGFAIVTFEQPFDTGVEKGLIYFDHVEIDTDPEYDVLDDEDDYYFNDMFDDGVGEDYFGNTYEDEEE